MPAAESAFMDAACRESRDLPPQTHGDPLRLYPLCTPSILRARTAYGYAVIRGFF